MPHPNFFKATSFKLIHNSFSPISFYFYFSSSFSIRQHVFYARPSHLSKILPDILSKATLSILSQSVEGLFLVKEVWNKNIFLIKFLNFILLVLLIWMSFLSIILLCRLIPWVHCEFTLIDKLPFSHILLWSLYTWECLKWILIWNEIVDGLLEWLLRIIAM